MKEGKWLTFMTQYRNDELTLEAVTWGTVKSLEIVVLDLVYALVSVLRLALWWVMWVFEVTWWALIDVLGTSLEGVTASLLPVPPPLPEGFWRGILSRFALVTGKDRCLILCLMGRLGRWSWETLLVLPWRDWLVFATVCCWLRWLEAEKRRDVTSVPYPHSFAAVTSQSRPLDFLWCDVVG